MSKRALILGGGGARGAFQAGVLKHLMSDLNIKYTAYLGVSVGAINAAYLSMFNPEKSKEAIKMLERLWLELEDCDIKKRWFPFGALHALWKKAAYNSKPLRETIYRYIDEEKIKNSKNHLKVGAACLETGEYKLFDKNFSNINEAVLASSAYPAAFLPVKIDGKYWIDGGVRNVTPIGDAIALGVDEIDVIMTNPVDLEKGNSSPDNALEVGLRALSILIDEVTQTDIEIALLVNELVKAGERPNKKYIKINIYRPDNPLESSSLNFDPKEIRKMLDHGYKLAKEKNK